MACLVACVHVFLLYTQEFVTSTEFVCYNRLSVMDMCSAYGKLSPFSVLLQTLQSHAEYLNEQIEAYRG